MKNIQIPYDLFMKLITYFFADSDEYTDEIKDELQEKLDSIVRRDKYAERLKSKNQPHSNNPIYA